jgi:hypothetical protein
MPDPFQSNSQIIDQPQAVLWVTAGQVENI